MKLATQEWLDKAEGDFAVAGRELGATRPVYEAVGFHAQQCAEKYLKGYLQEAGIPFPRIHDLDGLAVLVGNRVPALLPMEADLQWLSSYAVDIRYPGAVASRAEAERAVGIGTAVRAAIRTVLGLPVTAP